MQVPTDAVKEIRDRTNVGVLKCREALLEASGDVEKAIGILRQKGLALAAKKRGHAATEGVIEAYVHHTRKMGALVELHCQSDFVARTDEFKELARNLAMQVVATSPQFIAAEEMPPEAELDPQAVCLLNQPFIKEPSRTVQEIIADLVVKVGENIRVERFSKFDVGC